MITLCDSCGNCDAVDIPGGPKLCQKCSRLFPQILLKAVEEGGNYVARLSTGELIEFAEARIDGEFVILKEIFWLEESSTPPFPTKERPKDLSVRKSCIAWCLEYELVS